MDDLDDEHSKYEDMVRKDIKNIMTHMFPLDHEEATIDIGKLLLTHKFLEDPDMSTKDLISFVDNYKVDPWDQSLQKIVEDMLISDEGQSQFADLNVLSMFSIIAGYETVLIDMPEILLRMKIGNDHTLPELKKVFNKVCNAVNNRKRYKLAFPDTSLAA